MRLPGRGLAAVLLTTGILVLGGCAGVDGQPAPDPTEVTSSPSPTPSPSSESSAQASPVECDDLIPSERIASVLGSTEPLIPEEEYRGAARTVGGISCTWASGGNVAVISVLPRATITEPTEMNNSTDCINSLGHCFVSRLSEANILFVAGWDDQINRTIADEVEVHAATLELVGGAARTAVPDCEELAPVLEPVAGIGALSGLGTDNVPLRPVWHILADAGAAHFCVWGGTASTNSLLHAVYIWAYPGLSEPRAAAGERRALSNGDATLREISQNSDDLPNFEVTAWDGVNTVVVSGRGMRADAVIETSERLLEALAG